jgi:hypothetical protein
MGRRRQIAAQNEERMITEGAITDPSPGPRGHESDGAKFSPPVEGSTGPPKILHALTLRHPTAERELDMVAAEAFGATRGAGWSARVAARQLGAQAGADTLCVGSQLARIRRQRAIF